VKQQIQNGRHLIVAHPIPPSDAPPLNRKHCIIAVAICFCGVTVGVPWQHFGDSALWFIPVGQFFAIDIISSVIQPVLNLFSDRLALDFLFGGKVQPFHKTEFAIQKFVDRYEQSINTLNHAIIISVAFVPLALLASGNTVKIPMIDLDVSRPNWLRVCPLISYGLQLFTLVALCWFLILRRGLAVLREEIGQVQHFGDVSNILLTGVLGSLWMFVSIRRHFPSKLHLIWFIPLIFTLVAVIVSPSVLCGYFVRELFVLGDVLPALVYLGLLIPSVALSLVLIGTSVIEGIREAIP
jgi:hypothetical protein